MNFIEPHNFIIYQHLNMRIKNLPLATSQTAYLCATSLIMFPLPISMPCFKSIIFLSIYLSLKLSYFCKKMQKFWALEALPPGPRAYRGRGPCPSPPSSGGWGLSPQTPQNSPPMRISGYAPALSSSVLCANPTHKYPNCLFKYCTYICNNIPL